MPDEEEEGGLVNRVGPTLGDQAGLGTGQERTEQMDASSFRCVMGDQGTHPAARPSVVGRQGRGEPAGVQIGQIDQADVALPLEDWKPSRSAVA